jgi:hypothetical protein
VTSGPHTRAGGCTCVGELYASFVIAMIMPITTNTTIAICIQIQVGDTLTAYPGGTPYRRLTGDFYGVGMAGCR